MEALWSPQPAVSTVACTTASCSTQRELHCGHMSSLLIMKLKRTKGTAKSKPAAVMHPGSGEMLGLTQRGRQSFQSASLQELWQHQCCWRLYWVSALELCPELMFSGGCKAHSKVRFPKFHGDSSCTKNLSLDHMAGTFFSSYTHRNKMNKLDVKNHLIVPYFSVFIRWDQEPVQSMLK